MIQFYKHRPSHRFFALILCLFGTSTLYAMPEHQLASPVSAVSQSNQESSTRASDKLSWRLEALAHTSPSLQQNESIAQMLNVPETGAGSVVQNADGAVLTYIRVADTTPATLKELRDSGAQIVHISSQYNIVTAYVAPEHLDATAELNEVANIQEVLDMQSDALGMVPTPITSSQQASCPSGTISEGDEQLKAAAARATFGIDGAGVTVGALSDSFNRVLNGQSTAASDVKNGDLPGVGNPCGYTTPVEVVAESQSSGSTDEGRAMLHILHDLAPGAKLTFATAYGGMFAFADNVRKLKQAGAQVIVDDVSYLQEPMYQDGPVSVAIKEVTAQGAMYFKAVGNSNAVDAAGNSIGSYEAGYRAAPCSVSGLPIANGDCHAFNAATSDTTMGITLSPGGSFTMVLQWAQPWYGVETDLDLFLVSQGGAILARSNTVNAGSNGTQMPYESFSYTNTNAEAQVVQLVIVRKSGPAVQALKYVLIRSSGIVSTEYNSTNSVDTFGPTVVGHAAAAEALSVGAVRYNNSSMVERFSSRGPATIYFEPVQGATASAPLATPQVRQKPDLMASNGTRNPFFGSLSGGSYRFYGTSAAAPHAAAVAALMLQRAAQTDPAFLSGYSVPLLTKTASYMIEGAAQNETQGLVDALEAGYAFTSPRGASRWEVYLPQVTK